MKNLPRKMQPALPRSAKIRNQRETRPNFQLLTLRFKTSCPPTPSRATPSPNPTQSLSKSLKNRIRSNYLLNRNQQAKKRKKSPRDAIRSKLQILLRLSYQRQKLKSQTPKRAIKKPNSPNQLHPQPQKLKRQLLVQRNRSLKMQQLQRRESQRLLPRKRRKRVPKRTRKAGLQCSTRHSILTRLYLPPPLVRQKATQPLFPNRSSRDKQKIRATQSQFNYPLFNLLRRSRRRTSEATRIST